MEHGMSEKFWGPCRLYGRGMRAPWGFGMGTYWIHKSDGKNHIYIQGEGGGGTWKRGNICQDINKKRGFYWWLLEKGAHHVKAHIHCQGLEKVSISLNHASHLGTLWILHTCATFTMSNLTSNYQQFTRTLNFYVRNKSENSDFQNIAR